MKRVWMTVKSLSVALLAVALFAVPLWASGGGEGGGGVDWKGFFWQCVNFGVLVGLLYAFARKPIMNMLAERTEKIERGIVEARTAREAAEKALAEVDARMRSKDAEIKEMVAAARKSGEAEREALIEEGKRMSQRLQEQARHTIEQELRLARVALKQEAARYAVELAEKKIGQKLTPQDQSMLLEDAVKRLEGNKS